MPGTHKDVAQEKNVADVCKKVNNTDFQTGL